MNHLSITNNEKLNRAIQFSGQIVEVASKALDKFKEPEYSTIEYICIEYLDRFICGFDSLCILLKEYRSKEHLDTAIGILIRTHLLDLITLSYLICYKEDADNKGDHETKEQFQVEFDKFMVDGLEKSLSFLKLALELALFSKQEYNTAVDSLKQTYSMVFKDEPIDYDKPKDNLINRGLPPIALIFKKIRSHELTSNFSEIYDLYTYYSKYEHFGIMTGVMLRQEPEKKFETLIHGLKYLSKAIPLISLLAPDSFINQIHEDLPRIKNIQEEFNKL